MKDKFGGFNSSSKMSRTTKRNSGLEQTPVQAVSLDVHYRRIVLLMMLQQLQSISIYQHQEEQKFNEVYHKTQIQGDNCCVTQQLRQLDRKQMQENNKSVTSQLRQLERKKRK